MWNMSEEEQFWIFYGAQIRNGKPATAKDNPWSGGEPN